MKIFIALLISFTSMTVAAIGLEDRVKQRDFVLGKYEKSLSRLPKSSAARVPLMLRIADTLSEQARDVAFLEVKKGCLVCKAGNPLRERAASYYEQALEKTPLEERGSIYKQLGHLYGLLGKTERSVALYKTVIKEHAGEPVVGDAYFALGDLYYKDQNFPEAVNYFEKAKKYEGLAKMGTLYYQLGWSYFRMGQVDEAVVQLESLISNDNWLSKGDATAGGVADKTFKSEIASDLATFYGQQGSGLDAAKKLERLAPSSSKIAVLEKFATELRRLGFSQQALSVWKFIQNQHQDVASQIRGQIEIAESHYSLKEMKPMWEAYGDALNLISTHKACPSEKCTNWQKRLRKMLFEIHRSNRKQPVEGVLSGYEAYLNVFQEDSQAFFFAAEVAGKKKQYSDAIAFLERGKNSLAKVGKPIEGLGAEVFALKAIEFAELSKDKVLREKTYKAYLQSGYKGEHADRVRYQMAYLVYENENYELAVLELRKISLDSDFKDRSLKEKAADLALDGLAILKSHGRLEAWSTDFAQVFPERKMDFEKIRRQAIMEQANSSGKAGNYTQALAKLNQLEPSSVVGKEKRVYLKNRVLFYEKSRQYRDALETVKKYALLPELPKDEKTWALKKRAWYGDLLLDFSESLVASEQLNGHTKDPEKRLNMAMLADLGNNINKREYYDQYFAVAPKNENTRALIYGIVAESHEPMKELDKYKKYLISDAETYAEVRLKHSKSNFDKLLKEFNRRPLKGTKAAGFLNRLAEIKKFRKFDRKISDHNLNSKSQGRLSRSIKKRDRLLLDAKKMAEKASAANDWTLKMLAVNTLVRESARFHEDLMSLPMPEGLSPEEQGQYMNLLSTQAQPFQLQSETMALEMEKLKTEVNVLDGLAEQYKQANNNLRQLMEVEIEALRSLAIPVVDVKVASLMEAPVKVAEKVGAKEKMDRKNSLLTQLRADPFSESLLLQLMNVEKDLENTKMVSYLESRLERLKETDSKIQEGKSE
tara:strand:+ start:30600 stop:33578 length:2979 start_codon:yes stop_codon:yes gene_type:complete